jgi:hypothetical protein
MELEDMRKLLKPYLQRRHLPLYVGLAAFVLFMLLPGGYWQEVFFWVFIGGVFSWGVNEIGHKDKKRRKYGSIALSLLAVFVLLILILSVV